MPLGNLIYLVTLSNYLLIQCFKWSQGDLGTVGEDYEAVGRFVESA